MDCVFCSIIVGDIPAIKVYEDNDTLSFMDINPGNPGHLLVIPKQHYRNIFDIPPETAGKIMEIGAKLAGVIRDVLNPDGLNLFQSSESAAFQSVFHFHLHLLPRWEGDSLLLPWTPKPGDMDAIRKVAAQLQEHLK